MDAISLQGAITGINSAINIVKTLYGTKQAVDANGPLLELQQQLFTALQGATSGQLEHSGALERIRTLEEKIRSMETWEAEKKRYELKEIQPNRLAYVVKESMRGSEPPHCLCTNCYADNKKSIMQRVMKQPGGVGMQCPECKNFLNAVLS